MRKEHSPYKISSLNPPKMLKVGKVKYKYIHYYEKISKDYEIGKSVIKCIHPKLTWRLFLVKIRYNCGPTAQR